MLANFIFELSQANSIIPENCGMLSGNSLGLDVRPASPCPIRTSPDLWPTSIIKLTSHISARGTNLASPHYNLFIFEFRRLLQMSGLVALRSRNAHSVKSPYSICHHLIARTAHSCRPLHRIQHGPTNQVGTTFNRINLSRDT